MLEAFKFKNWFDSRLLFSPCRSKKVKIRKVWRKRTVLHSHFILKIIMFINLITLLTKQIHHAFINKILLFY